MPFRHHEVTWCTWNNGNFVDYIKQIAKLDPFSPWSHGNVKIKNSSDLFIQNNLWRIRKNSVETCTKWNSKFNKLTRQQILFLSCRCHNRCDKYQSDGNCVTQLRWEALKTIFNLFCQLKIIFLLFYSTW